MNVAGGRSWGTVGKTDYGQILGDTSKNWSYVKQKRKESGTGYMESGSMEYPGLGSNAYQLKFLPIQQ